VALAIAAVVVYGAAGFALPPLTFLAIALAFLVGVSPSFLPTRFRVDERGVARRTGPVWHRREWTAIRRAVVRARPPLSPRVWLSTEAEPGLLDRFRGMGLSVPVDDPRLLQELRHRLALHGL